MRLTPRAHQIISFVGHHDQVTRKQIRRVIFNDLRSATQSDRYVKRMVDQKLLARIDIRTVGGANGGSGQYVYQVGSAGWKLARTDRPYYLHRSVDYHALAIAEVYADIYEAQGERLSIISYETETNEKINYMPIQADMLMTLESKKGRFRAFFEVDLGTERPKQLRDKLARYRHASDGATGKWQPFPFVVWVVPDERRKKELDSLIALEPKESQSMYKTATFESVVEALTQ